MILGIIAVPFIIVAVIYLAWIKKNFVINVHFLDEIVELFARLLLIFFPNGRWLMHQDPSPDPGGERSGYSLLPDAGAGPEQGLFLTLPAGEFDPDQFAQSGPSPDLPPGALTATLMDLIGGEGGSGVAGLSDDQLVGFIAAAKRMESWVTWLSMSAIGEFTRRAKSRGPRGEFAADELAGELHLTYNSAAGQMGYAAAVAERLPGCLAALGAGKLNAVQLRIIEEETSILSAADAAKADAELADAGTLTYGKLRAAAHRLVLKLDPEADARRKEAARRAAEVRRFREQSGNAGMVARELPSADTLAAWQNVEQRAQALRAAGFPGTLEELRVRAFLELLQGRDSRDAQDDGPSVAAQVTITVPWSAQEEQSAGPAEVDGFGVVDHNDTRDLLAAAARDPRTRWCVTTLHPDGTASAHACVPGRHPPPGFAPGPDPPVRLLDWLRQRRAEITPITRGTCDHQHAEAGYRPSRKLQHLIRARNARCGAPGCGRPAARCDLDHTVAWDKGGLTCECNLYPLCRHHHKCKQSSGWSLAQPEPGILVWRTPAGRTYSTTPTIYPV